MLEGLQVERGILRNVLNDRRSIPGDKKSYNTRALGEGLTHINESNDWSSYRTLNVVHFRYLVLERHENLRYERTTQVRKGASICSDSD